MIQRINKGHSGASRHKSSGFSYKPRSEKAVKERAEQTGGKFDSPFKSGFDTYRPKVGDNLIRILPPTWEGDHEHYGLDIWVHGYVGPDNGTYLCLQKMKQKPCPICEAAKECKDAGENDEAKKLEPRRRVLVWILDRDGENPNDPVLYSMSWTTDRDIAALCHNKRTGKILLIDHPDDGYDIQFKRKGTTATNTEYYAWQVDRDSSPICDASKDQEKIIEFIQDNPLTDILKYYPADYLEKVMNGANEQKDPDADESEDDDDKPRSRKDDDSDDEEEDKPRRRRDDDDESEDDDKPKKSKRVRSDDDDEDTAEDDDKPKRGKRDDDDDQEDDDPPRSRRGKNEDDEEDKDERPSKGKRSRDDDEEEKEERPRSRRRDDDDGEEDDRPSRKSRRSDDDENDD